MNKVFEAADVVNENGEKVTRYDDKTQSPVVMKWELYPEHFPRFGNQKYAVLRAAEDMVIPSIWKSFVGVANNGINMMANALNQIFSPSIPDIPVDYNSSYRAVKIHTGVTVNIDEDEILCIYNSSIDKGLMLSSGVQVYFAKPEEIVLNMHNIFATDVRISKGDVLATAVFQKIERNEIENHNVNLNKGDE